MAFVKTRWGGSKRDACHKKRYDFKVKSVQKVGYLNCLMIAGRQVCCKVGSSTHLSGGHVAGEDELFSFAFMVLSV